MPEQKFKNAELFKKLVRLENNKLIKTQTNTIPVFDAVIDTKNLYQEGLYTLSRIVSSLEESYNETRVKIDKLSLESPLSTEILEKVEHLFEKKNKLNDYARLYRLYYSRETDYCGYIGDISIIVSKYLTEKGILIDSFSALELYVFVDLLSYFAKEANHVFSRLSQPYPEKYIILHSEEDIQNVDEYNTGKEVLPDMQYVAIIIDVIRKLSRDNIFKMLEILSYTVSYLQSLQEDRRIPNDRSKTKTLSKRIGFFYDWLEGNYRSYGYNLIPKEGVILETPDNVTEQNNITNHVETFDFFVLKDNLENMDEENFKGLSSETLFNVYILPTLTFYQFEHIYYDEHFTREVVPLYDMLIDLSTGAKFLEYL